METDELILNMGPVHPSTHGVLRFRLRMDGEIIKNCEIVMGYLHRGTEKLGEMKTYLQFIPYTDRLDYISAMPNNYAYVKAVEELAGIEVPQRAEYIRVMIMELNRIVNHIVSIGSLLMDLGAATMIMWGFRERETALQLFEQLCGARMTFNYIKPGGVREDLPEGFIPKLREWMKDMEKRLVDYEQLINDNEIFHMRMKDIGTISAQEAINYGLTGPSLRGSGVDYDMRKIEPYSIYPDIDFKACTRPEGDSYARYIVRIDEIKESLQILRQVIDSMPEGKIVSNAKYGIAPMTGSPSSVMTYFPRIFTPHAGEVYSRIEAPKGELGFYIVSDGTTKPYRVKIRSPSFCNLTAIPKMVQGLRIPDLIAAFGTIDVVLGDVDR
ncbi:MAG: NADH-quinone oxidoreductase subunit D [Candidatus Methanoperedens sp.]|nr:NADH-quinone oxidoreductase subunit D [Candidatus Methanoperedens sp.]MCE8424341.1 NADH-quinone oxidoreductase subunit D [Candidatus Methanoperedens sp.]MCE8427674.1 NADH-quinone oxidoreductase subunit D [Candidatus Methanoperedens sp.]